MRRLILALFILLPVDLLADEPAPNAAPAAEDVTAKSDVSAEQFEHLRSAAEHLAKGGLSDEAAKLKQQIAAMEHGHAEALLAKKEKELDSLRAEVDRLRKLTGREQQFELLFQIFEVSRSRLKTSDVANIEVLFPKQDHELQQPRAIYDSAAITEVVEALRKKDLLKVLAEPRLITVSGRPVMFNSGGEFPMIVPQGNGQVSVEYRRYGTGVDAVPITLGDSKVRLEVRAKASELDPSTGTTINGSRIPGLRERVVETAAELRFGEAIVINGPVQQRIESHKDAKGKLREVSNEIDMIVVITPKQVELVEPVRSARGSSSAPANMKK